jgi:hypothetical protein
MIPRKDAKTAKIKQEVSKMRPQGLILTRFEADELFDEVTHGFN